MGLVRFIGALLEPETGAAGKAESVSSDSVCVFLLFAISGSSARGCNR